MLYYWVSPCVMYQKSLTSKLALWHNNRNPGYFKNIPPTTKSTKIMCKMRKCSVLDRFHVLAGNYEISCGYVLADTENRSVEGERMVGWIIGKSKTEPQWNADEIWMGIDEGCCHLCCAVQLTYWVCSVLVQSADEKRTHLTWRLWLKCGRIKHAAAQHKSCMTVGPWTAHTHHTVSSRLIGWRCQHYGLLRNNSHQTHSHGWFTLK